MIRQKETADVADAAPISAQTAGLNYATDHGPGITRVRAGKGFRYLGPTGRTLRDEATLERIRALVIPPAWIHVWIAPDPVAHLQATGRDARGRKQYRYHARWREVRHQTKYDRIVPFVRVLPSLRRRVAADLRQVDLTKTKVVAAVVQLLEKTLIRVGNIEYAKTNKSFGLTTLRDGHVRIRGREVRFEFRGKSGVRQTVTLSDARLARIVKRCQDLPGQELFQYIDDAGARRTVSSADVNAYLRERAGADFTAKDFRTWAGTLCAALALGSKAKASVLQAKSMTQKQLKSTVVRAIEEVARHLGNTPAVCRSCYIHPAILAAHADGTLSRTLGARRRSPRGLSPDESAVLALLESRRDWREQLAEAARVARRTSRGRQRRRGRAPRARLIASRA